MRSLDAHSAGQPHNGKDWAIVVNQTHARPSAFYTGHELGHLILHGYTTPHADVDTSFDFATQPPPGSILEEVEANQFAAELLMPEQLLLEKLVGEGSSTFPLATKMTTQTKQACT